MTVRTRFSGKGLARGLRVGAQWSTPACQLPRYQPQCGHIEEKTWQCGVTDRKRSGVQGWWVRTRRMATTERRPAWRLSASRRAAGAAPTARWLRAVRRRRGVAPYQPDSQRDNEYGDDGVGQGESDDGAVATGLAGAFDLLSPRRPKTVLRVRRRTRRSPRGWRRCWSLGAAGVQVPSIGVAELGRTAVR